MKVTNGVGVCLPNDRAMTSSAAKKLEKKLARLRNKLVNQLSITSTVDDNTLLNILNELESCLVRMKQIPSKLTKIARRITTSLLHDKLLMHCNADVRIAVASCIMHLPLFARINMRMRDVFEFVSSNRKLAGQMVMQVSSEMNPQASGETQAMIRHNGLQPEHLPQNISAAMANEDGLNFLIKAMVSFPTKLADKSLTEEQEKDSLPIGTAYLTETDNRELYLPFVHHFGWIVRPFVKDNPFLEEIKRGTYLSVASFLREAAFLSCHNNQDTVLISNLQKCLKTMAETVKLNKDFVSFMSQYLEKRLVVQQAKMNAALVRKYQAMIIEAEVEYNKPWK